MVESWILGTPQHSMGICGIDFIPMQYRGIDNWPGLHYHQYSVSDVAGHFGGSRIEQGISVSRSIQSQCTNNKVHCSVLHVGNSSGVGEVLQCTAVSCQQRQ